MAHVTYIADRRPGPKGPTYAAWEDAVIEMMAKSRGMGLAAARAAFDTRTACVLLSWQRRRTPAEAVADIAKPPQGKVAKILHLPTRSTRPSKTAQKRGPPST